MLIKIILLLMINICLIANEQIDIMEKKIYHLNVKLDELQLIENQNNKKEKLEKLMLQVKKLQHQYDKSNFMKINGELIKYNKKIELQNKAMVKNKSYLNYWGMVFVITGLLIIVIVLFFMFRFKRIAEREIARSSSKWIEDNALEKLKPILDEYYNIKSLQANEKYNQYEKIDKKKESYRDIHKLLILKYAKKEYKESLILIEKLIKFAKTDEELYNARLMQGITLGYLNKKNESIHLFNKLLNQYKNSSNEQVQELVVKTLFRKAVILGELNRSSESINTYDILVKTYKHSKNEIILVMVVKSLYNHIITLIELDRREEAMKIYAKLIKDFEFSKSEKIQEIVDRTLQIINKDDNI